MKGKVIDLRAERERRRPRSIEVDAEVSVERGHVRVRLSIGDGRVRITGLIQPEVAHELGALLQRTALRVPPRK